uniref:PA14 domain-containing protein n=1 Tax=Roseihalotalea indica TaxID=2867963 RepID=A0AA49GLD3_9BACT|nr:PA14 domain-containing protein [Tunicatimonas sp. TK19036]
MKKIVYSLLKLFVYRKTLLLGVFLTIFQALQANAQGSFTQRPAGSTSAYWGYHEYLPSSYSPSGTQKSPVLITLHGIAGDGNGKSDLSILFNNGIPRLLKEGKWAADRPFVVISPQSYTDFFNKDKLHDFISYVVNNYNIDKDRIYLTGQSGGAISIWAYLEKYQDQVAAVVPVAGNGVSYTNNSACSLKNIPIWAFHGSSDNTVGLNGSILPVQLINNCSPAPEVKAKVTIYKGVGHNSWDRTYDLSGMNSNTDPQYDSYNVNIYDWLLNFSKGGGNQSEPPANQSPTVSAGDDISVEDTQTSVKLSCQSSDSDGQIVSLQWEKVSGPEATMQGETDPELTVSNLSVGVYELAVTVKDDDGATAQDVVKVTVNEGSQTSPPPSPSPGSSDCGCDHIIDTNNALNIINASDYNYSPGDVFCIKAGTYNGFRLIGFKGTSSNPVVFKNCGGLVNIQEDRYSGIQFQKSQYVRITGSGDSSIKYGIHVSKTKSGVSGVAVSELSSDFEIDHVEVSNVGFAGIIAKTDPSCSRPETWRGNFLLKNLDIHDNYIHDTGGEGMYIGGTFGYETSSRVCDGTQRFAHLLENVKVHNNIIKNTGWDGLQISLVHEGAKIYNNEIRNYGTERTNNQNYGIAIGAGTKGEIYNNKVIQSSSYTTSLQRGISVIDAIPTTKFYNNVIVGAGQFGIWMHIRMTNNVLDQSKGYVFANNTIVNPGGVGIFYNTCIPGGDCREYIKGEFYNNLVVNPGTNYDNSGFWKEADDAFIDFNTKAQRDNATKSNNIFSRDMASLKFVDAGSNNFDIKDGSPVIDAGKSVAGYGVTFDLDNSARPAGNGYDVGAFESGSSAPTEPENQSPNVNAGQDMTVEETQSSVQLTCQASDPDGQIVSHLWKKVSGPAADLQGTTNAKLTVSNLNVGSYEFSVTVKDNDGATASDKVKLVVEDTPDDNPGNGDGGDGNGLTYEYYEGSWSKLPAYQSLTPKKTGTVSNFSLSPKLRGDKFGFRYDGFIEITKAGQYTFYTTSDDGSTLEINGSYVVKNDGLHGAQERSGKVTLSAGYHAIRVRFFEASGGETLNVQYAGPGISKQNIPDSKLYTQKPSSTPEEPTPEEPTPSEGEGLAYSYYEGTWSKLPDFSKLTPKKTGTVANFSLSPKLRGDKFGFRYDGFIEITKAGEYTFYTTSDDGSKLLINGTNIVSNDGTHGAQERSGKVTLSAGYHAIRVRFFENSKGETLEVKYAGPGISKQTIPNSKLYIQEPSSTPPAPTPGIPVDEETVVYINFGNNVASSPWNNTVEDPRYTKSFPSLKDASGNSTNIGLTIMTGWGNGYGGGFNDKGATTGDNSGAYPDKVMQTAYWVQTDVVEVMKIDGLVPGKAYEFTFFASRVGTGDRTTKYSIAGKTVSLNASNNTSKTVSITSTASQAGEVSIEVQKAASASYGYLNALVITELTSYNTKQGISTKEGFVSDQEGEDVMFSEVLGDVTVFPNPVSNQMHIQLPAVDDKAIQISIMDLSGTEIYKGDYDVQMNNMVDIDFSEIRMSSGLYILNIMVEGKEPVMTKFFKE